MKPKTLKRIAELGDLSKVSQEIEKRKAQGAPQERAYAPPTTPVEETLAGFWAQVLRLERVGIHDNFFDLGGNSLLATQLMARIRQHFNLELPLLALFQQPTIAQMSGAIAASAGAVGSLRLPQLGRTPRDGDLPLSLQQQRLWFLDQLEPGTPRYNIVQGIRLKGGLRPEILERSLNALIERHEILRTSFAVVNDQPVERVAPACLLKLPVHDITGLDEPAREREAQRLASEEAQTPFDLTRTPLLRARLIKLAPEDQVLVIAMHHIASDGWSFGLFAEELGKFYAAFLEGRSSPLPPLPIQYADYAAWQRRSFQGEALRNEVSYWKQKLQGAPPALDLPTDRPRPSVQSYRGQSQTLILSRELTDKLQGISQSHGATLFMCLLAGFQALLARYTGKEDIVVGSAIAGRSYTETEGLIGFFVNTLVLRNDLSGNPSFLELLGRVRDNALEAFAHQQVPFERLVEEIQPERSLSHNPLFQVAFALQNVAMALPEFAGVQSERFPVSTGITVTDLGLFVSEIPEGLRARFEYSTELFDDPTISRLMGHWQTLLEAVAEDPEKPVMALPILTEREKHQVLVEWNQTQSPLASEALAHQLVEEHTERHPDATGLVEGNRSLSYGELNRRANQLAHTLKALGMGRNDVVGIYAERSIEMIVAQLGILKAGAAFLPIDPAYPKERVGFILEDSDVRVLLAPPHLAASLPPSTAEVVTLDREWSRFHQASIAEPQSELTPDDLAYVIYTSGSTGKPKGVEVPHRGLRNLIHWYQSVFQLTSEDRNTQLAGPAFDAIVWEIWPALAAGASLYLPDESTRITASELVRWYRDHGITVSFLPTPLAEAVLEENWPERSCMRLLHTAGDKLHRAPRQPLSFLFYNLYGPTENSVCTSWIRVPSGDSEVSPPIGRPISNVQLYVLDRNLQPVPIGVPGELCIGGASLARGYHNRPELTAEKFISNPFSNQPGSRLYRSGDLVRYLADGNLEFLGRIDEQVKVRGFRIELGEIETVLVGHPGVREAAVVAREDTTGQKRLVAYLVPSGPSVAAAELAEYLRRVLPDYMVPAAFVSLSALPVTPNGKVDRRALPAPEDAAAQSSYVAPRTATEEILANIWADVLHRDRIGIYDDFFELGGHSLLATQVVSRLRRALAKELPLRVLFEAPTVAALADHIAVVGHGADRPPVPELRRRAGTTFLPLSFAQQRLWFLDQLEPDNPFYNIPIGIRLSGPLDVGALEWALTEIVRRHEVLRTTYGLENNSPVQKISPPGNVALPVVDLTSQPEDLRQREGQRLAYEEAQRPFNLASDLMLRARLIRLASQEHMLVLVIHHIAGDGWSMGVFSREIAVLYQSRLKGGSSPLPELAIQYGDYTVWQREWLRGQALDEQLAYWKKQLAGAPATLDLPTDRPRPAIESFRGAFIRGLIPQDLVQKLSALSRKEGVTLFMTLLAGFQTLLARYTGKDDIVVGSPIANRVSPELENLIGFFVNSLALRTSFSGDPSFRQLLERVREVALGAYAHQNLPFEKLVEELSPERSLSHNPLFQVSFVLQNAPMPPIELAGLTLNPISTGSHTSKFDLTLFLRESEAGLACALEYNTDLFDASTMERMLGHYEMLLRGAVAHPDRNVAELPLVTDRERHQLLVEWNQTAIEYPRRLIAEMFEEQVERSPDATAVLAGPERLSFRTLNQRANRLAHYLRERGTGPESLVAICMERTAEVVVALLGVLKSGAAYVPLDPGYPPERLAFMLEDSGARVLVTEEKLRPNLPEHSCEVVSLDEHASEILKRSGENFPSGATLDHLAYVIYTSGSTGRPKGAMILHRGLTNYVAWASEAYGVRPGGAVPVHSSISFDLTVTALYVPLVRGAAIELLPEEPGIESLAAALRQGSDRSLLKITPAHLELLNQQLDPSEVRHRVRSLIIGGENLRSEITRYWLDNAPETRLVNEYGPTETVVGCCVYQARGSERLSGSVPIGRPIANTELYILDLHLEPVPVGIAGELHIGGAGVARGYLNRPELTAERFIRNPFSAAAEARLYKTGDLARYLPDGNIEYLGRIDQQVKLRGFRVEPGEIEAVVKEHRGVEQCVVIAREDQPGNKQLVAYVVADSEYQVKQEAGSSQDQVSEWQATFEESYRQGDQPELGISNITGWNSSYTGEAIGSEEMQEWVERTVERILSLRPRRVLEIGCGTGLLLFRVAPHCGAYCGTDFSQVALEYVRAQLRRVEMANVRLEQRTADDLRGIEKGAFDLVILNSVIQYFPNVDYLIRVIQAAAAILAPGGKLFLGDVRNLAQVEMFRAAVELAQAPATMSREELRKRVEKQVSQEEELVVDPRFFYALAGQLSGIARVQVSLKRGRYRTEMNQFRYDVVVEFGTVENPPPAADVEWLDWGKEGLSIAHLRTLLEHERPEQIGLDAVPDARVWPALETWKWLGQASAPATAGSWRDHLPQCETQAIEPEALWSLGEELGYDVSIGYRDGGAQALCEVVFSRHASRAALGRPSPKLDTNWSAYANDPLQARVASVLLPELRRYLDQKLPDYMVPSAFVLLKSLPLTPNGKVDRQALPAPDVSRKPSDRSYLAPRTPVEEVLANMWAEVLGLEQVGIADNFFDLGGHSLLATQVVSRIRQALHIELPLRALFETPTVAGVAEQLERLERQEKGLTAPPFEAAARNQHLPLSFAQQRLWFMHQLHPADPAYNVPLTLRLKGPLQVNAVERALNEVVRRHEILRTSFAVVNDQPVQVIARDVRIEIPQVDLTPLPLAERESQARQMAAQQTEQPFDLSRGPLLRAKLLRVGEEDHVLLLDTHHIITDGWSHRVMMNELAALYEAFADGKSSPLPELKLQYADYAVWQRGWLQGEVLERQLEHWRRHMEGAPPVLELPTDRPRSAIADCRGALHAQSIPRRLTESLRLLGRETDATLYMTLLGAYQYLLSYYSGQNDIVVGTDLANRNLAETEPLIGFFVNLLPLRTRFSPDLSFRQIMESVRETALGAYAHQDVPFEKLVETLEPERSLSQNPLVQVLFVMQNATQQTRQTRGLAIEPLLASVTSRFDLVLFVNEKDGGLLQRWMYKTSLFDPATIAGMAGQYENLLNAIAVMPDAKLKKLFELLAEHDKQQRAIEHKEFETVSLEKLKMRRRSAPVLSE